MKDFLSKAVPAAAGCLLLAACAGPQPAPYTGLASSALLKPYDGDGSDRIPYRFTTTVDWPHYQNAIIDPVTIYRGADNQFGKMSEEDRQDLARYMQTAFTNSLGRRFVLGKDAVPGTARVDITLTGAAASTPVISTFAHLDIGGNLYNGVQAIRGGDGLMTGWVMYAVEIHDASSGELLEAYEEKQYPNALNPLPTFGSLAAAKAGIDKGSDALAVRLQ